MDTTARYMQVLAPDTAEIARYEMTADGVTVTFPDGVTLDYTADSDYDLTSPGDLQDFVILMATSYHRVGVLHYTEIVTDGPQRVIVRNETKLAAISALLDLPRALIDDASDGARETIPGHVSLADGVLTASRALRMSMRGVTADEVRALLAVTAKVGYPLDFGMLAEALGTDTEWLHDRRNGTI